ncbi:TPA: hypothetical protein ACH3X2_007046 [Trebouxia sp. C0005]
MKLALVKALLGRKPRSASKAARSQYLGSHSHSTRSSHLTDEAARLEQQQAISKPDEEYLNGPEDLLTSTDQVQEVVQEYEEAAADEGDDDDEMYQQISSNVNKMSAQDVWLRKYHELWEKLEENTKSSFCTALWKWLAWCDHKAFDTVIHPIPKCVIFLEDLLQEMVDKKSKDPFGTIRVARKALSKIKWSYRLLFKDLWHADKKQDRNALAKPLLSILQEVEGGPIVKSKVLHLFSHWAKGSLGEAYIEKTPLAALQAFAIASGWEQSSFMRRHFLGRALVRRVAKE